MSLESVEQQLASLLSHTAIPKALVNPDAVLLAPESVTEEYIANLAVTNAKIANATIQSAKIVSLAVDKLAAGSLSVAMNLAVGGKITIGDADPAANGGVLIDDDEVSVYAASGDNRATLNDSGIAVVSEHGTPFFSIKNQANDRSIDFTMETNSGRSLWLSSNVNGQKSELVWIDQVIPANTATSQTDIFSFAAQAIGAVFMIHCHRTDTGASLGHIFAANGSGVLNYVSTTDTEASSAGTTSPYIGLNGSDGLDFGAHVTHATRFVGLCLVIYS